MELHSGDERVDGTPFRAHSGHELVGGTLIRRLSSAWRENTKKNDFLFCYFVSDHQNLAIDQNKQIMIVVILEQNSVFVIFVTTKMVVERVDGIAFR